MGAERTGKPGLPGPSDGSALRNVARLGPRRELHFDEPMPLHDLPRHVRAGSAVRRVGARLLLVQDDVNALVLLDPSTGRSTPLLLPPGEGGRRTFGESTSNKAAKMDLEACVALPDGRLVVLGSGSTAARERLVVVTPEADRIRLFDASDLFAAIRVCDGLAGAEINLEGAVVAGHDLVLLQRGNGLRAATTRYGNAVLRVPVHAFVAWIDGVGPAPHIERVEGLDLGSDEGVELGVTDAANVPGLGLAVLACAEDSPDAVRDGPVLGSWIALFDGRETARARILAADGSPTRAKLEGLELIGVTPQGDLEFVVVADVDDENTPTFVAPLTWCRARD